MELSKELDIKRKKICYIQLCVNNFNRTLDKHGYYLSIFLSIYQAREIVEIVWVNLAQQLGQVVVPSCLIKSGLHMKVFF